LHVCWHKKILAFHVFRKYRLKTIYGGTNFSSFLNFRLILSITAQSIFTVEPSAWARWKCILIENITKIKNNNNFFFFTWGHWKWSYPKSKFLIFFKFGKLVEDYLLLFPSKPLVVNIFCFRKYWFLNTVTPEIVSVFCQYLGHFFWKITHFKGILIRKIKKIR
jgi:hypothetical protein